MDPSADRAFETRRTLLFIALGVAALSELLAAMGIGAGVHSEIPAYLRYGNIILSSCLLAGAVVFAASKPPRSSLVAMLALGTALEVAHAVLRSNLVAYVSNVGAMYGIAALAVSAVATLRARADDRKTELLRLMETAMFPAFLLVARLPVELTVILHPSSFDAQMLALDQTIFGTEPAFAVGRVFANAAPLRLFETLLYIEMPVAAAVVYVFEKRSRDSRGTRDVQVAFLVAGLVGVVLYHACAVAGPHHAFATFPGEVPPIDVVLKLPYLAQTRFRNAIPSLHTTWALLVYWHARRHGRGMQIFGALWFVGTIVAMLGLGEHYLTDVAISIPFAVACRAALAQSVPLRDRARALPLTVGSALFLIWVSLLHAPPVVLGDRVIFGTLALLSSLAPLVLEARLAAREMSIDAAVEGSAVRAPPSRRSRAVALVVLAAGLSAGVAELVLAKSLAIQVSGPFFALLVSIGVALGAFAGGRLQTKSPLKAFAGCQIGVGVSCAIAPMLAHSPFGAAAALVGALLSGATVPLLLGDLAEEEASPGRAIALVVGAGAFGGAVGALLGAFLLVPTFGLSLSAVLAVVPILGVALVALRMAARNADELRSPEDSSAEPNEATWIVVARLFLVGLAGLGIARVYASLLATLIGDTFYAFTSAHAALLFGVACGGFAGRAWIGRRLGLRFGTGLSAACLATAVLASAFGWAQLPAYFASYAGFFPTRVFSVGEFIRFMACCLLLVPAGTFIGASAVLAAEAMRREGGVGVRAVGTSVGLLSLGAACGVGLADYVLISAVGSLHAFQVLVALVLVLVVVSLVSADRSRRRILSVALGVTVLLALVQPKSLDLTSIASGSNVHYLPPRLGTVIDHAESADGLTTVSASSDADGRIVRTLAANGRFVGDDSPAREMKSQYAFALLPLLHTEARNRALVIGLGTGAGARVLSDAGFRDIDIAEPRAGVVALAARQLASANARVLERKGVTTVATSGRAFLARSRERYDLVALMSPSVWFDGGASLYGVELYEAVRDHLTPNGVVQHAIPLGHVEPSDLAAMLASARSVFPHVWVYLTGGQGVLVACADDCRPTMQALAQIDRTPAVDDALKLLGGRAADLLGYRVLAPESVDRLLSTAGAPPSDAAKLALFVSSDDNLFLEHHTPRSNLSSLKDSVRDNEKLLRRNSPPDVFVGTRIRPAPPPGTGAPPP